MRLIFSSSLWIALHILFFKFSCLHAQCCSANPVIGSSNIGTLGKKTLREIAFYRYSYSDTYYEGTSMRLDIHYLRYSWYSYIGNIISYGITDKITADLELGYYLKKTELTESSRKLSSMGLNNGIISMKYGIIKKPTFECTIGGGLKFPFSKHVKELDGRPMSISLQPSSNAFGAVFILFLQKHFSEFNFRLFFIHRAEVLNAYNSIYYMKGNTFFTNLFLSKSLNEHWGFLLQLRNEFRTRDYHYDKAMAGTGGILFFVSPQINYSFKGFNFALLYDIPIYRNVNEQQIVSKYAFSFIFTKDFSL